MSPYIVARSYASAAWKEITERGLGRGVWIKDQCMHARVALIGAHDGQLPIEESLNHGWALLELFSVAEYVTNGDEAAALRSLELAMESLSSIIESEPIGVYD